MAVGTVKTVTDKGFGFINTDESEKDVFYHENSLTGDLEVRKLRVGDKVSFDIEKTQKGLNAINIVLVTEE
ncbi:cold shock domain-containing protein [Candidatus Dojkabacteria bacterium]|nr:cold shock domain-containing protein [Candidatus Dojkabacteria bacterium]